MIEKNERRERNDVRKQLNFKRITCCSLSAINSGADQQQVNGEDRA